MPFVFEGNVRQHQFTIALNEYLLRPVNQNIVYVIVLKKRFKGAKAGHFVVKVLDERRAIIAVQNNAQIIQSFC